MTNPPTRHLHGNNGNYVRGNIRGQDAKNDKLVIKIASGLLITSVILVGILEITIGLGVF